MIAVIGWRYWALFALGLTGWFMLLPDDQSLSPASRDGGRYLSGGMRQLNGLYTQRFNRRHGLAGHLFQGRYKR